MTPCFHPRLVNGPFHDPALYIDFLYQNRAILFDIGDISALTTKHIHKITDVFVTHTHMDHFIGLDYLIRLFLGRDKRLSIYGPPRIIDNVAGKLSAYTWNLVDNFENSFEIHVFESHTDHIEKAILKCHNLFQKEMCLEKAPFKDKLLDEDEFSIHTAFLDHFTPCLTFCLKEKSHINIKKDVLDTLGLPSGPWLNQLKTAIRQQEPDNYPITIKAKSSDDSQGQKTTLGWVKQKGLFTISQGQKIAYVTDIGYTQENISRLTSFAMDADYLFCEAAFLEEDSQLAKKKCHLTAHQAGLIARQANARKLIPFHFSPRYQGREDLIYKEAERSFTSS
ncbi:ribonuclease Z [bacterium]|nr:ribonuclease Z [bacterium]